MIPAWVAPLASLAVAIVGATALVIVRKIRGPVTIQDLWAENRQLREDLDAISTKVDTLVLGRETDLTVKRIMGEGFDALDAYVERTSEERGVTPTFTRAEQAAIDRARALREDDSVWTTSTRPA